MSVCPVLVGREAEMTVLEGVLEGGGGVVLVGGEAGVGKSRLVREFASRAADGGHVVVWGRPEAVTRPGPYSLMVDLLEDLASVLRAGEDEARELLEALTSGAGEQPARPIAARARGLLANLGRAPVVVVEDLHWADEPTHAVLAHLARSARDDGALLVGTYRPEETGGEGLRRLLDLLTRDRIAVEIELAPLGRDAVTAMLDAMWDAPPTPDEVEAIERLGEGIPFFVEELAAAREALSDPTVPATIARAVEGRLARLDETGRAVVRAASLTDGAIDPAVLADVAGAPEADVPRHLVDAVRAGLLEDREGRLVFRHALVREAIADGIVSVEKTELHRHLAAAIVRFHADELESHALALAKHHEAAGEHERAAGHWVVAGRRAMAAGALEEARAAFDAALGGPTIATPDAKAGLAEVLIRTHELDRALVHLREAADDFKGSSRGGDAARALSRLAWILETRSDPAATEVQEEALALARHEGDEALVARLLIEQGYTLARALVDHERGAPLIREGAKRAQALGDPDLQAEGCEGLAWIAEFTGDRDIAEEQGRRACTFALQGGRDELIGKTHSSHALRLALRGRCREALEMLESARDRLVLGLGSFYLPRLDHARAWIFWRMGEPSEADRLAGRLEATDMAAVYGRVIRIWAALERSDRATARAILDSWWTDVGGPDARAYALARPREWAGSPYPTLAEHLFRILDDQPLGDDAVSEARAYYDLCRQAPTDALAMGAVILARILLRAGRPDEACAVADEIDPAVLGDHALRLAELAEVRGRAAADAGEALKHFDVAVEHYRSCENALDRARCMRLAAESARVVGAGVEEIGPRLKEAREIAASVGGVAETNRIESVMRGLGLRPRAGRPKGPRRPEGTLSAREEEVAALLAAGASNGEIAAKLFISERTVQDHIANAQRRLSVSGRAGLAAWAAKQGLV